MQTTRDSKATQEPRPALTQRVRQFLPARKPSPSGLSREELRTLVREMIG